MIKDNIARVKERIAESAGRAGRDMSGIKLIAVSKTKPAEDIYEAYSEGLTAFGENYVQEMLAKQDSDFLKSLPNIEWHMIGHIQTNKVKHIVGKTTLIHSLDSIRLAEEIQKQANKLNIVIDVLLEINIAREKNKFGFFSEEVENAVIKLSECSNINVCGLMTSAPFTLVPEQNRLYFRKLHELSLDIRCKSIHNIHMRDLSMGMSGDFEVAIEEGATMLRIGTSLFGQR